MNSCFSEGFSFWLGMIAAEAVVGLSLIVIFIVVRVIFQVMTEHKPKKRDATGRE